MSNRGIAAHRPSAVPAGLSFPCPNPWAAPGRQAWGPWFPFSASVLFVLCLISFKEQSPGTSSCNNYSNGPQGIVWFLSQTSSSNCCLISPKRPSPGQRPVKEMMVLCLVYKQGTWGSWGVRKLPEAPFPVRGGPGMRPHHPG